MERTIGQLVREMENFDRNGTTTISKYVTLSMREDIEMTEAYINSKHISGDKDYLGREKPFFNIVTAARNIWFRATNLNRKDIKIRATKEADETKAFLATILLQQWMKKEGFGKFLNDWGLSLATHGSSIVKFIEKEGELNCNVIDWNTIFVDQVDFEANMKVEKLWYTPAQLKKQKAYDQELVDKLLDNLTARQTIGWQKKDNKAGYIPIYEVHGELPLNLLTDNPDDEDDYVQQMHVITFHATKDTGKEFDDYTLYSGRESKDPYMLTHLIKRDGITYSGGAVKNLFNAQWMVNHTQKMIKDQLDLASKIIFQTSDTAFAGSNVLVNVENGDILTHKTNEPLTQLANKPDIGAMQSFQTSWQNISSEINGISEAMQGEHAPSGVAWRQVQALLQESHSLFQLMSENKGLCLIDMLTDFIIPHFKKQLNNDDAISMILEDYQIKQIDARYLPAEASRQVNQKIKNSVLSGQPYNPAEQEQDTQKAMGDIQGSMPPSQRFIVPSTIKGTTWKEMLKDIEWELDIDITGEMKDVQGAMATLTTIFQTITTNPQVLDDPNVKLIFNKILSLTGAISPLELKITPPAQKQPTYNVSESMSFKDLPPDGKIQMAKQAGIDIKQAQPVPAGAQAQ